MEISQHVAPRLHSLPEKRPLRAAMKNELQQFSRFFFYFLFSVGVRGVVKFIVEIEAVGVARGPNGVEKKERVANM